MINHNDRIDREGMLASELRARIADFLISLAHWIDGSGWHYDPFNAGYVAGLRASRHPLKDKPH